MNKSEKTIITSNRSSNKNSKKGFTLVELIVVLVVLAILAAAVIPALLGYTDSAKEKQYIADAEASLKASQAVLSDIYNDSSSSLNPERRDQAERMAGVKYNETKFTVWTSKQLVDGETAVVKDNMGSFTIQYAIFETTRDNEAKYVLYDGKDWTVFDDIEELNTEKNNYIGTFNIGNQINMWPYSADTAYNPDKLPDGEQWAEGGEEPDYIEIIIHNSKGVLFNNGTDTKTSEITVRFERGAGTDLVPVDWTSPQQVVKSDATYEIELERGFKNLKWSKNQNSKIGALTWDEVCDQVKSIGNGAKLYAVTDKDKISREIIFGVINPFTCTYDGRWLAAATFYKNDNDYDKTYAQNADIEGEELSTFSEVNEARVRGQRDASGTDYTCYGYAFKQGISYECDALGSLIIYDTEEKIWNKVFSLSEREYKNVMFVPILKKEKSIRLIAEDGSSFKDLSGTTLDLKLTYDEIKSAYSDIEADYEKNKLVPDSNHRHVGWEEVVESGDKWSTKDKSISAIRDYVISADKKEFEFKAKIRSGPRAKFLARSDMSGNGWKNINGFPGQMNDLSGNNKSNNNFVSFQKIEYSDGVRFLKEAGVIQQVFSTYDINNPEDDKAIECGAGHYKQCSLNVSVPGGKMNRLYILWDGNDIQYDLPIFAYNVKGANGKYSVYWFSQEDSPLLDGCQTGLFDNYPALSFEGSCIDDWDTSKCTHMDQMFMHCGIQDGEVEFSAWDVSSVTTMKHMFKTCTRLTTCNLSGWNAPSCTTNEEMFVDNKNIEEVSFYGCNFHNTQNFSKMFYGCSKLTSVNFDRFDTYSLNNTSNIFTNANTLETFSARGWNAHSLQSLKDFFKGKTSLKNVYLNDYNEVYTTDFSTCSTIESIFDGCTGLETASLDYVQLPNCKNINKMFNECTSLKELSFNYCDMSEFSGDFYQSNALNKTISLTDFSARYWKMGKANGFYDLFKASGEFSVTAYEGTDYVEDLKIGTSVLERVDFTGADLHSVKNMDRMFKNCTNLKSAIFKDTNLSSLESFEELFYHNRSITYINLEVSDGTYLKPKNLKSFFDFCDSLELVDFGTLEDGSINFDTSDVTDFSMCFYNCKNLKRKYFEEFDYTSAKNFKEMLAGVEFDTVDFTGKEMNNLETVELMFRNSKVKNVIFDDVKMNNPNGIDKFDTIFDYKSDKGKKITEYIETFSGKGWQINYGNDAQPNTVLSNMFSYKANLKSVNLSDADLPSVSEVYNMFRGCPELETITMNRCDMSGITVFSNATNPMFQNDSKLKEFIAQRWNVEHLTSFQDAFKSVTSLETFDISNANISSVNNMNSMFYNCNGLVSVKFGTSKSMKSGEQCNTSWMFASDNGKELRNIKTFEMNFELKVGIAEDMFKNCIFLKNAIFSNWSFVGATNLKDMFIGCSELEIVNFGDSTSDKITTMQGTFYNTPSLKSVYMPNIGTASNCSMNGTFGYDGNAAKKHANLNSISFNASVKGSDMYRTFYGCSALTELDLSNWDLSYATTTLDMFWGCTDLQKVVLGDGSNPDRRFGSALTSNKKMFRDCNNLKTFDARIFGNCPNLEDMSYIFYNCYNLHFLDFSNYYTSDKCKWVGQAFYKAGNVQTDNVEGLAIFCDHQIKTTQDNCDYSEYRMNLYGNVYREQNNNDYSGMIAEKCYSQNNLLHLQSVNKNDIGYVSKKVNNIFRIYGGFFNCIEDDTEFFNEMKTKAGLTY